MCNINIRTGTLRPIENKGFSLHCFFWALPTCSSCSHLVASNCLIRGGNVLSAYKPLLETDRPVIKKHALYLRSGQNIYYHNNNPSLNSSYQSSKTTENERKLSSKAREQNFEHVPFLRTTISFKLLRFINNFLFFIWWMSHWTQQKPVFKTLLFEWKNRRTHKSVLCTHSIQLFFSFWHLVYSISF